MPNRTANTNLPASPPSRATKVPAHGSTWLLSTLKDSAEERTSVAAQKLAEVGAKAGGVSAYVLAARGDETVKKNNAMWNKFCKWLSIKKYADMAWRGVLGPQWPSKCVRCAQPPLRGARHLAAALHSLVAHAERLLCTRWPV